MPPANAGATLRNFIDDKGEISHKRFRQFRFDTPVPHLGIRLAHVLDKSKQCEKLPLRKEVIPSLEAVRLYPETQCPTRWKFSFVYAEVALLHDHRESFRCFFLLIFGTWNIRSGEINLALVTTPRTYECNKIYGHPSRFAGGLYVHRGHSRLADWARSLTARRQIRGVEPPFHNRFLWVLRT